MVIRLAKEEDLPQILKIYAPYITDTTVSFEYTVPTEEEFAQRFSSITRQFPWLVWEENGEISGYAYGSAPFERAAYSWCAESSIYLAPHAKGRGIGRALQTALEEILTLQGYRILYALITSENAASLAFHKAVGFAPCAEFPGCGFKFGREHGVIWLQKNLNGTDVYENFPVSVKALVDSDRNINEILDKMSLS